MDLLFKILQNCKIKLLISNFNTILIENNKKIWSEFCVKCWTVEKTKNVFNFHSCDDNNSMSSNIEKSIFKINANSSIIVASVIDNWSSKSLPYSINSIVYISHDNFDRIQYISTDEIIVTANLFLDKEFDSFVKNSVYLEDLVVLHCSKLLSRYQIKCTVCYQDLKSVMINNFKFSTKHEWFVHSSLSWLRTIVCHLNPVSPVEYILEVFSDSMVYTKTFIQVLSTMLPDHAIINCLNKKIPTYLNFDAILQDLRELRKVFMEYLDGQIMIPRKQWNSTRSKLSFT
uniref:Uncharacterized protein n=1 Tax=Sipha flava TaxID=143950 RepID=A0A2S2R5K9_9HEMI